MSTQMKDVLTTLELLTKEKIDPETVLEEDEIEETLTINEDGELLSESPGGILVPAGAEAAKRVYQRGMDAKRQSAIAYGKMNAAEEDSKYVDDRYGPGAHSFVAGRPVDHAGAGMDAPPAHISGDLGDVEGIPKVADVDAQTRAVDDYSSQHPVPATTIEKLKKIPSWYWDTYADSVQSLGRGMDDAVNLPPKVAKDLWSRGVKDALTTVGKYGLGQVKGTGEFIKRRYDAAKNIVNSDYTIEDANIILEDYDSIMEAWELGEELNSLRRLSGLKEDEDVWAYSPMGKGTVARVVETDDGLFQVYVEGPNGWIAQGQPHATQEEAEADAKSFWEDYNKNVEYDTARHNAKTGHMA